MKCYKDIILRKCKIVASICIMYLTSLLKDFKKSMFKMTFESAELREQKHSSEST